MKMKNINNVLFFRAEPVAKEVIKVIKYAPNGTSWVIEAGEPAYQYVAPDRNTMKHNVLSSM